jgi:DNA helicase IV
MALAHGLSVTRSQAVRSSEWPVAITDLGHDATLASVSATVVALIGKDRLIDAGGTIAVIASSTVIDDIFDNLALELGDIVGRGAAGLTRAVAVLTPQEAKGLEFDSTIVVGPQRIVDEIVRGAAALYVAMTRPTQRLHLVTEGAVPAGIRVDA